MRSEIISKDIGNIAEINFIHRFITHRVPVSIPYGNAEPYDIIIETIEGFKSIQIKNANYKDGKVTAYIDNRQGYSNYTHNSYKGVVDYLGIYCPQLDECYIIPSNELNNYSITLRIDEPKIKYLKTLKFGKDYLLSDFIYNLNINK